MVEPFVVVNEPNNASDFSAWIWFPTGLFVVACLGHSRNSSCIGSMPRTLGANTVVSLFLHSLSPTCAPIAGLHTRPENQANNRCATIFDVGYCLPERQLNKHDAITPKFPIICKLSNDSFDNLEEHHKHITNIFKFPVFISPSRNLSSSVLAQSFCDDAGDVLQSAVAESVVALLRSRRQKKGKARTPT